MKRSKYIGPEEAISVAKTSGQEFADSYILASSRRLGAGAVADADALLDRVGALVYRLLHPRR